MTSFTKGRNGRWCYEKDQLHPFYYVIPEGSSRFVASVDKEANARLIAAAPEMYELLGMAMQSLRHHSDNDGMIAYHIGELLARIDGKENGND